MLCYSLCVVALASVAAQRANAPIGPHTWPMYQYQPDHNAAFPGPSRAFSWHRKLGGKVNGGLAVVDGTVYVESFDKRLYALDAQDGGIKWTANMQNIAMTAPIVADGVVVVGTGSNRPLKESARETIWGRPEGDYIQAFSVRDGLLVWQQRTVGENMPTPALVRVNGENTLVFANGDNHARALRLRDGQLIWSFPTQGIATMSSAAAAGNMVYFVSGVPSPGSLHDSLYAVDGTTGANLWRVPLGNVDCSPTIENATIFVEGSGADSKRPADTSTFSDVVAIDAATGRMKWSWRSAWGHFTPTASHEQAIAGLAVGGILYQSIPASSEFAAFDAAGHTRWKIHTEEPVKMSAVLYNGKLYFGDTGHTLYVVDAATGQVVGGRTYPSYFTVSPPVIVGATLYITNDDTVLAIPLSAL
jgi:outer membrane protein assembly factor BamB